ncbi:protein SPIRAL1-like 1 [Salvia miltiorrhiza]|uniref:protein SPIRAL1-like 1 n=1 Tax=Salvia miltiorrhiza TaxID=226208 RepID=UPI0025AD1375|nr:protein SPIRAL1-like 1 [Salvia miltiorrhiza]
MEHEVTASSHLLNLTGGLIKIVTFDHRRIGDIDRGVSSGGGQSSLGYLFGSGEAPKPAVGKTQTVPSESSVASKEPSPKPNAAPKPVDVSKQIPAGIHSSTTKNYVRADGQSTCNFITDRPSTKVHAAPEGGSSLGYLFGGGSSSN